MFPIISLIYTDWVSALVHIRSCENYTVFEIYVTEKLRFHLEPSEPQETQD